MRVAAVIAEYNPFHNGHAYHLRDLRKKTGCDSIIVIMSGCFVQRGEPAIADKWQRAEWALSAGADLVLELPVNYALGNAQAFARGAIRSLAATGVVDILGLGCETDDVSLLKAAACDDYLATSAFRTLLNENLKTGKSYPRAVHEAITISGANPILAELYSKPNAVLALEYIRAINEIDSDIDIMVTLRKGTVHNSKNTATEDGINFASASAIRERVFNGFDVGAFVPPNIRLPSRFISQSDFSNMVMYALRIMKPGEMLALPDVSEGINNSIYRISRTSKTYDEMLRQVKSKRYTMAKIKRICMCAMLGIRAKDVISCPAYIRILGVRKEKLCLLSQLAKCSSIPVVVNGSDSKTLDENAVNLFKLNTFASDTYGLVASESPGQDYCRKLLKV